MSVSAKKERLELRVTPDLKASIEAAALICRISISQFIAESAFAHAEAVINEHRRIKLTEESWLQVAQALDNPPAPNERFRRAVERMSKDDTWKWDN